MLYVLSATLLLNATQQLCVETARSLGILQTNVPVVQSAICVVIKAIWLVIALTLVFHPAMQGSATTATSWVILQSIAQMRKPCNNCRKPSPLARDCPNEPVCHTSNISGHEAHHCAKSSLTPDIRGPFLDIMCRTCGMLGHICRECVSIVICNNCGGTVEGVTKPMSALKP
ncbi:hypothetical protein ACFX13_042024 [Malus domestica]|uniref:CCHC-type domain-containing protein n=1 Tax=Malus domestica TaxID=3750 RepID=A0A498JFH8_MALDO|nr:hypothetical protein DVH24_024112 [Malus domestica]